MPLQKYSLTPAPNAWDALLDCGADARQLYAHLVLGRLSERTGLIHCRRKGIERDLGLRGSQLDAALVDIQQAGVASVSDLGNGSIVIALLHYLEIVPTRPNNRRGWILDAQQIPNCDAKAEWLHRLPGDPQPPEYTGGRGSLVKHKSNTSGSPKQKRTEEKRTKHNPSPSFPSEDSPPKSSQRVERAKVAWAAWLEHLGSDPRSKQHRSNKDGLPASKELRGVLLSFVGDSPNRDFDDYFSYLAGANPWGWFDNTFSVNIEWACRPATRRKVAAEGYGDKKSSDKRVAEDLLASFGLPDLLGGK